MTDVAAERERAAPSRHGAPPSLSTAVGAAVASSASDLRASPAREPDASAERERERERELAHAVPRENGAPSPPASPRARTEREAMRAETDNDADDASQACAQSRRQDGTRSPSPSPSTSPSPSPPTPTPPPPPQPQPREDGADDDGDAAARDGELSDARQEGEDEDAQRASREASVVRDDDAAHSEHARSDDSSDDPFAELDVVSTMDLFDVSNYTFGIKNEHSASKLMQSMSKPELYEHLRVAYQKRGIRRSVGAVILVHNHRFPHILLLQRKDGRGEFVLPGGRLRPGESNEDGLQRKLLSKLTPSAPAEREQHEATRPDVGEKLCSWYAVDFDRRYFPYVPAHVTKPKEELHIYAVSLPSKFTFAVPNNLQLLAVPLFDVFNNSTTYGDVISAVPSVLSKYHFNYC